MKNKMTAKDLKAVYNAYDTLDKLNRKYGQPYGWNPAGIMFHAYKSAEALTQKEVDKIRRAGQ